MGNALGTQPAVAPLLSMRQSENGAHPSAATARESASLIEELMANYGPGAFTLEEMRGEIASLHAACATLRDDIVRS